MRLLSLHVQRFGVFEDASWRFAPGLNVIRGPNESGKSTMREAIVRLLFAEPKVNTNDGRFLARTRWGSERDFVITGEFEVDGSRYVLTRDFAADRIELVGDESDALTDEGRVRERLAELLEPHSRAVYESTACFAQQQFAALAAGERLSELLQQNLAGPEAESGARAAVDELDADIKSLERGLNHPAKRPGPLRATMNRIAEMRREADDLRPLVGQAEEAAAELQTLSAQRDEIASELEQARALVERVDERRRLEGNLQQLKERCTELDGRIREARRLEEQIEDARRRLDALPEISTEQAQRVRELTRDIQSTSAEAQSATADAKRLAEHAEAAQKRLAEAEEAMPDEHHVHRIEDLQRDLERLTDELDRAQPVAEEADRRLESAQAAVERQRSLYVAAALMAALGVILGIALSPWLLTLAVAGLGLGVYAAVSGSRVGLSEAERRHQEATEQVEGLTSQIEATRGEIDSLLGREGAESLETLKTRIREARERIVHHRSEYERASAQSESALGIARQRDGRARELEGELESILAGAGVDDASRFLEMAQEVREVSDTLARARSRLEGVLGSAELAQLEVELSDLSTQRLAVQERLNSSGLAQTEMGPDEYQRLLSRIERLQAEMETIDERTQHLRATALHSGADPERLRSLEERIAEEEERLERLKERRDALVLARDLLAQAHEETLSPAIDVLEPTCAELVSALTCGRYADVSFDRTTLEPAIYSAAKGANVDLDQELSCATREQVYLAARLALTRLIWPDGPPPLLLDDPLVNFDARRQEGALAIVRRFAEEAQVLLFTCHEFYDSTADHLIVLQVD